MAIATSPNDLMPMAEIATISGLEFMQAILDGRLPGPPIGATLGITCTASRLAVWCFAARPNSMSPTRWAPCMAAGTARCWIGEAMRIPLPRFSYAATCVYMSANRRKVIHSGLYRKVGSLGFVFRLND